MIARLMGVSFSGHYFNELYLINFFVFVFSFGLDYAAIAWISRNPELRPLIHRKLVMLTLLFFLFVAGFLFFVLPILPYSFNQPLLAYLLFAIGNLMLTIFQGLLTSLKKFKLQNTILLSVNTLFAVYLACLFNQNETKQLMLNVSIGYASVFFIQGALMLYFSFEKTKNTHIEMDWITFLKYGFYMMISSVVYFVFLRADNFFVEKYADSKILSNYIQCGKIGQYFIYFTSIVSSSIIPYLSSEKKELSFRQWKRITAPYILLMIFSSIILFFTGKFIYPFVFGNGFNEMNSIMQILLPGYLCLGILTLLNSVYIGNKNVRRIFWGDFIGLLFIIVLDYFFAPIYGVKGITIISSLAYCFLCIYLFIGFKKQFQS